MSHEIPPIDLKKVNKKELQAGISDVIGILKLDKTRINAVADRESEGINIALVYIFAASVVASVGQVLFMYSNLGSAFGGVLLRALVGGVIMGVMSALVIYVSHMVAARLFKGKSSLPRYFRVMGYASLIGVLGFISALGGLASIYLLVVNFMVLQELHKLDTTNAVLVILVTIGVFMVLSYILGMFGLYSFGMGGMMSGFNVGRPNVIISY
jgi:hypothetical protein